MTTPRLEQALEPVLVRPSDGDAVFASGRTAWLDENAAKPAEPLPPIEVIKIAPINKPQHD